MGNAEAERRIMEGKLWMHKIDQGEKENARIFSLLEGLGNNSELGERKMIGLTNSKSILRKKMEIDRDYDKLEE